ncbi:hypothetical protein QFC21_006750 [Naganishia friedmannii]|uniref:Uncharacterized protein n=1 Tax=Naganishia friedmannii TaxID=89922 RepID=A0ACC2V105_9TREE|nr:hypothetical protein QFC21_006750 [Naganishia friedmannii]
MSEREPLLTPPSGFSSPPTAPSGPKRLPTPVPWRQLIVLCLMRLAEPIASGVKRVSGRPNRRPCMRKDLSIRQRAYDLSRCTTERWSRRYISPKIRVKTYWVETDGDDYTTWVFPGVIESVFGFTQCMTVLTWGRLSDKWGRRPVILLGIFGVILSTLSFGFGKAFWWLIASRCINGGQSQRGYLFLGRGIMGWSIVISRGSGADGLVFFGSTVALNGNVPAIKSVGGISLESKTKPKHHASLLRGEADLRIADETGINDDDDGAEEIERNVAPPYTPGIKEILASPTVRSTSAIGSMLSLYGFLSVTVQLTFFPSLHRRFGTITCLRGALPGYLLVAALAPIITKVTQAGASRNTVYAMVAGLVLFKAMSNTAFASTSILIPEQECARNG